MSFFDTWLGYVVGQQPEKQKELDRQKFWESKWKTAKITYKGDGKYDRDVRTYLVGRSHILEAEIKKFGLSKGDYANRVFLIEQHVRNKIKYKADVGEQWESSPEVTLQKKEGDCEDHANLIKSLSLVAGVPDWMHKNAAGWVIDPNGTDDDIGHCYGLFLIDDDTWCAIDSTYRPQTLPLNKRLDHKSLFAYNPRKDSIWWTYNLNASYAQKNVKVEGRVKE